MMKSSNENEPYGSPMNVIERFDRLMDGRQCHKQTMMAIVPRVDKNMASSLNIVERFDQLMKDRHGKEERAAETKPLDSRIAKRHFLPPRSSSAATTKGSISKQSRGEKKLYPRRFIALPKR